jgi:hypothetical protein
MSGPFVLAGGLHRRRGPVLNRPNPGCFAPQDRAGQSAQSLPQTCELVKILTNLFSTRTGGKMKMLMLGFLQSRPTGVAPGSRGPSGRRGDRLERGASPRRAFYRGPSRAAALPRV